MLQKVRFARDGRFIEKLGFFNPLLPKEKKERIGLESERIKYWLSQGAQPTTRVARILGENNFIPMPKSGNNPNKAIPKKERKKEAEASKEESEAKPAANQKQKLKRKKLNQQQKHQKKKLKGRAEAKPAAEAKPKAEAKKEEAKPAAEAPKEEAKKRINSSTNV